MAHAHTHQFHVIYEITMFEIEIDLVLDEWVRKKDDGMKKRINNKEKSHLQHALTLVVLVARLVPNSQVYTYLWWYDVACNRAELIKAQEPEKKCQETNAKRTSG